MAARLHRFLGAAALIFTGIHVLAILLTPSCTDS